MRTDSPRSRRVLAGGLQHRVLEWEGRGPSLVIVHGYLDCALSFRELVSALPPDLHVIAPDLRGHGATERVGGGGAYHFQDYVRDLRELVDACTSGPIALLGHSMGGSASVLFAGAWPQDVERLVLLEGLGPPEEDYGDGPARLARWVKEVRRVSTSGRRHPPMPGPDAVAARLVRSNPGLSADRAARLVPGLAEEDPAGGWSWRHDPLHRTRSPSIYRWERVRPFAEAVECPVLLVAGGRSWYLARDLGPRRSALRDARLLELPDAGHMLHHDAPERVGTAVGSFLAGKEPPGSRTLSETR